MKVGGGQTVGSGTLRGGGTAKEVYRMNNGEGKRNGGVEGVRSRRAEIDEGHLESVGKSRGRTRDDCDGDEKRQRSSGSQGHNEDG